MSLQRSRACRVRQMCISVHDARRKKGFTEAQHPAIEQSQQLAAAVALPIAPSKNDITERTGEVVDFCVECLHPSERGGLTLLALFRDYQSWCRALGLTPVAATSFETEFVMLAEEFGIARDHDRFVGVRTSLLLTVGEGMGRQNHDQRRAPAADAASRHASAGTGRTAPGQERSSRS